MSARIGQEIDHGRGEFIDSAHGIDDASVADEVASEEFTEAEHNADVLQQVRDASGVVEIADPLGAPSRQFHDRFCRKGIRS